MANKYFKLLKLKPAKNLTERRKALDEMVDAVKTKYEKAGVKQGSEASKIKKKFWRKSSDIHDKYEKDVKASKKAKSTQTKKAGRDHFYMKNIKEMNKHKEAVKGSGAARKQKPVTWV